MRKILNQKENMKKTNMRKILNENVNMKNTKMRKIPNQKENMEKTNMQKIPNENKNMKKTNMRKILNQKKNIEKTNMTKILKQKNKIVKRCIKRTKSIYQQIKQGPYFICVVCRQCLYKRSVRLFEQEKYYILIAEFYLPLRSFDEKIIYVIHVINTFLEMKCHVKQSSVKLV